MEDVVRKMIAGANTEDEIRHRLIRNGLQFDDLTDEYGYKNIRIPVINGYIRIYKMGNAIKIQNWQKTVFKYSGIPTFEPSGRRSL